MSVLLSNDLIQIIHTLSHPSLPPEIGEELRAYHIRPWKTAKHYYRYYCEHPKTNKGWKAYKYLLEPTPMNVYICELGCDQMVYKEANVQSIDEIVQKYGRYPLRVKSTKKDRCVIL